MRIAFGDFSGWDFHAGSVDSSPLGGSHSAACYLARALARQGHEIFLINNVSAPIERDGVTCFSWASKTWDELRSLRLEALVCMLDAGRGALLRTELGPNIRLVLWAQNNHVQPGVKDLHDAHERNSYDGFAMVSQWQGTEYTSYFGIDPKRMAVLRNAIAPAFLGQFPDDQSILTQKTLPPILAYTSTPYRGLDWLLDAFPFIRAAVPGTRLGVFSSMKVYHASPKEDEAKYGHLYQRCRQMEGVEYVGSLPQVQLAPAMREVMVLAYPNTFAETSCIAVMEAMASGCRIVTSDFGALAETTAGFASLIPRGLDRETYLRLFIEETVRVLHQSMEQNNQTEELLRRQVTYINRQATWESRACEWARWLATLTPRSRW